MKIWLFSENICDSYNYLQRLIRRSPSLPFHQCQRQTKSCWEQSSPAQQTFVNVKISAMIYWFTLWSRPDSMWSHAANRYMTHITSGCSRLARLPPSSSPSSALWKASLNKPSISGWAATHRANIRPDSCSPSAKTSRARLGAAGLRLALLPGEKLQRRRGWGGHG